MRVQVFDITCAILLTARIPYLSVNAEQPKSHTYHLNQVQRGSGRLWLCLQLRKLSQARMLLLVVTVESILLVLHTILVSSVTEARVGLALLMPGCRTVSNP